MRVKTGLFYLFVMLLAAMTCPTEGASQSACDRNEESQGGCQPKFSVCGWGILAFNFQADALFLYQSNRGASRDFTSLEIGGKTVLSSKDLNSRWAAGWRLMGEVIFDTCDRIDVSYLQCGDWSDSASASDLAGNLFSLWSDFGRDPYQGYPGVDHATKHKIDWHSGFSTWEINYRDHICFFEIPGYCRVEGAVIYGFRHFDLEEALKLKTYVDPYAPKMSCRVETENSLNGLQLGAEAWIPAGSCIDIGLELKGDLFLNQFQQKTRVYASELLDDPIREKKDDWGASWGVECALKASYELTPCLYLRMGYLYLFVDDLALAASNFNKKSPFEEGGRRKKLSNSDAVSYQGINCGVDWCW